jgi:hypothetical protein
MEKNLDGVYFRVCREGKWCEVCFSNLTEQEAEEILKEKNTEWLILLSSILVGILEETIDIVQYKDEQAPDWRKFCIALGRAIKSSANLLPDVRDEDEN